MPELKHRVGSRVREIRKSKHLTQLQVSDKVNLSLNMIGYIERGEKFPSATTFEKLAKGLDVLVQDFFTFPVEIPIDIKEKEMALKEIRDLALDTPPKLIKSIIEIIIQIKDMARQQ